MEYVGELEQREWELDDEDDEAAISRSAALRISSWDEAGDDEDDDGKVTLNAVAHTSTLPTCSQGMALCTCRAPSPAMHACQSPMFRPRHGPATTAIVCCTADAEVDTPPHRHRPGPSQRHPDMHWPVTASLGNWPASPAEPLRASKLTDRAGAIEAGIGESSTPLFARSYHRHTALIRASRRSSTPSDRRMPMDRSP